MALRQALAGTAAPSRDFDCAHQLIICIQHRLGQLGVAQRRGVQSEMSRAPLLDTDEQNTALTFAADRLQPR